MEDFNEPKTLLDLPYHILDKIFDYLDLNQKKEFSQVCKRFNEIFSSRKNLQKIWFHVQKNHIVSDVTRSYVMLSTSGNKKLINMNIPSIPRTVLELMSTQLEGFRLKSGTFISLEEFCDCLPFFENLTYLDILFTNYLYLVEKMKQSDRVFNSTIKLNCLKHLKIHFEIFCCIDGRYIEITSTKLLSIEITYEHSFKLPGDFIPPYHFDRIRALISRQKNLKNLFLKGMSGLFDRPLITKNTLENIRIMQFENVNRINQDNLCDFINSQQNLKRLCVNLNPIERPKMFSLLNRRLELPLIEMKLNFLRDVFNVKDFNFFTLEDLQRSASTLSNLATKKLDFRDNISSDNHFNIKISLLVFKFPNLTSIEIVNPSRCVDVNVPIVSFAPLNGLKNLKHLKLKGLKCSHLRDIHIPSLYYFHLETCFKESMSEDINCLREFLNRHGDIRRMVLKLLVVGDLIRGCIIPDVFEHHIPHEVYTDILRFSLLNLKKLMTFVVVEGCFEQDNLVFNLIREHANQGFVLEQSVKSLCPM